MNKARLFVVNEATLQNTIQTNIVSILTPAPVGEQWLKTFADIMADMLQIEIGDYIFLWETRSDNQKSCIHGVYRAISKPYYELSTPADKYPFKIKVERAYLLNNPLDEYDVFNCPYIKIPLWTLTGKKVAGKSRGTSPLSPSEATCLITLLIGKNPDYVYFPFDDTRIINVQNPLKVEYTRRGENNLTNRTLNAITPNQLCFFNNDSSIKYEKILETIFNQEMANRNVSFFTQIGINANKVIWFCNYLPYSIEQSEMDYLVIESDDHINFSKIFLIEFIKSSIDNSHIYRSMLYSKWVNETLALGTSIVQPIVICPNSFDFINGERTTNRIKKCESMNQYIKECEQEFSTKELQVYTYDFSGEAPLFRKKR